MFYIGLDVHKKSISYSVKDVAGKIEQEGVVRATRADLNAWMATLPQPWMAAMEATLFTGWIYDHVAERATEVKVAHPLMLRAIAASRRKNDRIDASKICDALRCNLLPESYMAPAAYRDLRRGLRYRNLLVRQMVQLKNKMAGLLMETGVPYNKQKLHQSRYFGELLTSSQEIPAPLRPLLELNRKTLLWLQSSERSLIRALKQEPLIEERVRCLVSIPCVGAITALTWVLEVGEVKRLRTLKQATAYCGLCGDEKSSGEVRKRTPLTRQCNHWLRQVLIEAAKLAPRHDAGLAEVYQRERDRGRDVNAATLAVARKLVAYLLAVDRRKQPFTATKEEANQEAAGA